MKKTQSILAVLLCVVMLLGCFQVTSAADEGQHFVFRIGCSSEAYRAENLIAAAEMLNEQLAAEGSKDTVEVVYDVVDDFASTLTLWMRENNLPEFIAQTKGTIAEFYRAGALVDASYVVNDEV